MGLFDKKEKPKANFSDVRSGSSTTDPFKTMETSKKYTVQKGDTLSAIAKREYGDASEWRAIYDANRDQIQDPDMIHPGQELNIPTRGESGGNR
jgi:nucleoid-associated protein YgaU